MCWAEMVVCDWFVATTALFPIIDSNRGPFLSSSCARLKKDPQCPKLYITFTRIVPWLATVQ